MTRVLPRQANSARMLPVYALPNMLTLSRLLLAPVVAWRLPAHDTEGAFWLFGIAAITLPRAAENARRLSE